MNIESFSHVENRFSSKEEFEGWFESLVDSVENFLEFSIMSDVLSSLSDPNPVTDLKSPDWYKCAKHLSFVLREESAASKSRAAESLRSVGIQFSDVDIPRVEEAMQDKDWRTEAEEQVSLFLSEASVRFDGAAVIRLGGENGGNDLSFSFMGRDFGKSLIEWVNARAALALLRAGTDVCEQTVAQTQENLTSAARTMREALAQMVAYRARTMTPEDIQFGLRHGGSEIS